MNDWRDIGFTLPPDPPEEDQRDDDEEEGKEEEQHDRHIHWYGPRWTIRPGYDLDGGRE